MIGKLGLAIEVVNNFATEGFYQETITKNTVKADINVGFGKLGDAGVSATKTVAGKAAIAAGANIILESIIQGTTEIGGKVAEKLSQDLMKKKN